MGRHESKELTPARQAGKTSLFPSRSPSAKTRGSPSAIGVGTSSTSRPASTIPFQIQRAVEQLLELAPMLKRLDEKSRALAIIIKEGMIRHSLRRLQATTDHATLQERTTTKTDATASHRSSRWCTM